MAGGDNELSVATLSLGEDEASNNQLDDVRQSVIACNVDKFLEAAGDEYEAFVHVLGIQEDEEDAAAAADNEAEKDLEEMEAEAGALMTGFGTLATALLQRLAVDNVDSIVDRHGWTLLMQAANSGLSELLEELIKRKVDVNYGGTAKDSTNSLYLAIESEHTEVALLLLKNGAIASATKLVTTPSVCADQEDGDEQEEEEVDDDCALFQACRFGHLDVIKEMIALGVDVNFALPSTGDRALHVAVMFEMKEVVELLVESKDIELNALNESGQTCLFGGAGVELLQLLIAKGVDPKIKDVDGETALSMAKELGDDEVAEFLETVTA
ncbi:hypothetical protein BBJ29_000433 [Phytophthora kernoviae]|uniref:Uncharacterized protein n=1 Tax=Phytophthora kernoviae TaxID=325452 RepID=A0A3F2RZG7_9STRA|nr:hypothetical protein BBJ29_000433 [Phytophthora kernoviae]RLN67275.1 hypothetical protein BBP00_00001668 [Phytophthora kernoviae]